MVRDNGDRSTLRSPFGVTGELYNTGLVSLRARWYDPAQGRFLQRDSFTGGPMRPQSLNHYAYTENNPFNWTDPSGQCVGWVWRDPTCQFIGWHRVARGDLEWADARPWAGASVDFTPGFGDLKGFIEAFTGRDLVTGEDLGAWRWAGLVFLSELRHLRHLDTVGRVVRLGDAGLGGRVLGRFGRPGRGLLPAPKTFRSQNDWDQGIQATPAYTTVYRFADRKNPETIRSNLSRKPQDVQDAVRRLIDKRGSLFESIVLSHASLGAPPESPFVSVLLDHAKGAQTPDPWLATIIWGQPGVPGRDVRRAPDLGEFSVPTHRLIDPENDLSTNETEKLFLGDDLEHFLVKWIDNPYDRPR